MSDQSPAEHYLADAIRTFRYYKKLAEGAFGQINDEDFFRTLDKESNSVAVNIKHLAGNMISRWTGFLTSDGEKPERDRDMEFEMLPGTSKADMLTYWEKGWQCVFAAVEPLQPEDLMRTVRIRGQDHTVIQAIKSSEWKSLSVPRNKSAEFNARLQNREQ
jgi:hypothetical protein